MAAVRIIWSDVIYTYDQGDYAPCTVLLPVHIKSADWSYVLLSADLEEATNGFERVIVGGINKYIPSYWKRSNCSLNGKAKNLIFVWKRKKWAHRRYKQSCLDTDYQNFPEHRKKVKFLSQRQKNFAFVKGNW